MEDHSYSLNRDKCFKDNQHIIFRSCQCVAVHSTRAKAYLAKTTFALGMFNSDSILKKIDILLERFRFLNRLFAVRFS